MDYGKTISLEMQTLGNSRTELFYHNLKVLYITLHPRLLYHPLAFFQMNC